MDSLLANFTDGSYIIDIGSHNKDVKIAYCRLSSGAEQLFRKQQAVGPNPTAGSFILYIFNL